MGIRNDDYLHNYSSGVSHPSAFSISSLIGQKDASYCSRSCSKMTGVEYENRSFWEKKWITEENIERRTQQEESWTVGVDGEDYFDRKVLKEARGKRVLDIGCGRGEHTLSVAAVAKQVVGVNLSKTAISQANVNTSLERVTTGEAKSP